MELVSPLGSIQKRIKSASMVRHGVAACFGVTLKRGSPLVGPQLERVLLFKHPKQPSIDVLNSFSVGSVYKQEIVWRYAMNKGAPDEVTRLGEMPMSSQH